MNQTHARTWRLGGLLTGLALTALLAGCTTTSTRTTPTYGSQTTVDDHFESAADRPPTAATMYRLGTLLAAQGRDAQAESVLVRCTERFPEYGPAYTELASLYIRHRNFDAAVETLESGLERIPNDPVLRNDAGMCWVLAGNYERAHAAFALASEASPDDARFRSNLAMATAMLGRYDEALEHYMEVIPAGEAHYNLGVICEARDDAARAETEFAAAVAAGYLDRR